MSNWKDASNIIYPDIPTLESNYQNQLSPTDIQEEQDWVDDYLAVIINLMGTEEVWNGTLYSLFGERPILKGIGGRANSRNDRQKYSPYNIGWFSGAHWTSHWKGDTRDSLDGSQQNGYVFDPYDKYQVFGTNQFCQTFALMWLASHATNPVFKKYNTLNIDRSSEGNPYIDLTPYYEHTELAVRFIREIISDFMRNGELIVLPDGREDFFQYSKEDLLYIVDTQLLPNINRCLNVIEMPSVSTLQSLPAEEVEPRCNFVRNSVRNSEDGSCYQKCNYPFLVRKEPGTPYDDLGCENTCIKFFQNECNDDQTLSALQLNPLQLSKPTSERLGVGTDISFSCDKCTEIWMPWPFDNIKFCLRDVLDDLAEALLKAVLGLGSETACVPILEGIVQTIALANLEDGIGEAIEVVLNPEVISALCGYIFEELIPRYGKTYSDEAKNAVLDWLCEQF